MRQRGWVWGCPLVAALFQVEWVSLVCLGCVSSLSAVGVGLYVVVLFFSIFDEFWVDVGVVRQQSVGLLLSLE